MSDAADNGSLSEALQAPLSERLASHVAGSVMPMQPGLQQAFGERRARIGDNMVVHALAINNDSKQGGIETGQQTSAKSMAPENRHSENPSSVLEPLMPKVRSIIYVDRREFVRECFGKRLQEYLTEFHIQTIADLDILEGGESAEIDFESLIMYIESGLASSDHLAELMQRLKGQFASIPVVFLTDSEDVQLILRAFDLGVSGFITTSLSSAEVAGAIRLTCAGGSYVSPRLLLQRLACQETPRISGFSQRQMDVLKQVCMGKANKIIAYELGMSEHTVKVHVRNIMKQLGATNRTQVAHIAHELFSGMRGAGDRASGSMPVSVRLNNREVD